MHNTGELLKTDALGRERTPVKRREALLAEFPRSRTSARKFAEPAGVNCRTFGKRCAVVKTDGKRQMEHRSCPA